MTDLLMLDSVDVGVFAGLQFDALAGYVGGSWPTYAPEVQDYPNLAKQNRILSIAVNASEDAEALDCETGDATPDQVPGWIDRQLARGVWRPCVYANLSTWQNGLSSALAHYGDRIRRWVADWTYQYGVMAGFDAQQCFGPTYLGRNIDASSTLDNFFAPVTQPPHVNPIHYDWFPTGPFPTRHWGSLNERLIVEEYDGARKDPVKYKNYLLKLEAQLWWLRDRVCYEAMYAHPHIFGHNRHKPSWDIDHRGWRRYQLERRSRGVQFVH